VVGLIVALSKNLLSTIARSYGNDVSQNIVDINISFIMMFVINRE
jgi:hypothetical protein